MAVTSRRNVPALTGLLTLVSLALVFGAALGVIPRSVIPAAPDGVLNAIPHVNAVISTVAVVTIAAGWYSIRRGNWRRHRALMASSFVLFAAFLALYLYKVSLQGPSPFPGPETVYQFVYLPVLGVHMVLAVLCIPLLYYVLLLGATQPVGELPRTNHARVGRVAAALWLTSFVLGNVVYALLYLVY